VVGTGKNALLAVIELGIHDDDIDLGDGELTGNVDPDFALVLIEIATVDDNGLGAVLGLESGHCEFFTGLSVAKIVLVNAHKVLNWF
jgi:hypothetical protein